MFMEILGERPQNIENKYNSEETLREIKIVFADKFPEN